MMEVARHSREKTTCTFLNFMSMIPDTEMKELHRVRIRRVLPGRADKVPVKETARKTESER